MMIARDTSLGMAPGGPVETFYSKLAAHTDNIAPLGAHVLAAGSLGLQASAWRAMEEVVEKV